MLAIRITRPYSALVPFFDKLQQHSDKLIVYEHTESARPHIHGLIVNCKPSTDTLKNWIRSVVGKVEKTDWSFVSKDVNEKFITYMSKGNLEPKLCCGFGEDQVSVLRDAWEERRRISKQTRLTYVVKETTEERKLRQTDMIQEIIKRVEASSDQTAEYIIGTIYRVVCIENRNVLGRFKLRDYYDTVLQQVRQEEWMHGMRKICTRDYLDN